MVFKNHKPFFSKTLKLHVTVLFACISFVSGYSKETVNSCSDKGNITTHNIPSTPAFPYNITAPLACSDTSYTQQKEICEGDSITVGTSIYDSTGTYEDSLTTEDGCDSVITTELTVHPVYHTRDTISVCPGDSAEIYGAWRDSSRTYYDTLTSQHGCDSIQSTYLNFYPEHHTNTCSIIPENDSLYIHGTWEDTAGVYVDTFTNKHGCDSIHQYTLYTGTQINMGPDTISACQGNSLAFALSNKDIIQYEWSNSIEFSSDSVFSFNYKEEGNSSVVNVAATLQGGCTAYDTTFISDSTLRNVKQEVPFVTDPLVTFQVKNLPENTDAWYWSFGDGDTLTGETLPVHKYQQNGTYNACLIGINECNQDSSCFSITISEAVTGLDNNISAGSINIYPNPAHRKFTVSWPEHFHPTTIRIVDPLGRQVRQRNISHQQKATFRSENHQGLYLVELITSEGSVKKKILIR